MSKCCSDQELQEILYFLKSWLKRFPNGPERQLWVEGLRFDMAKELVQAIEEKSPIADLLLEGLKEAADAEHMTLVELVKRAWDAGPL